MNGTPPTPPHDPTPAAPRQVQRKRTAIADSLLSAAGRIIRDVPRYAEPAMVDLMDRAIIQAARSIPPTGIEYDRHGPMLVLRTRFLRPVGSGIDTTSAILLDRRLTTGDPSQDAVLRRVYAYARASGWTIVIDGRRADPDMPPRPGQA